MPDESYSVRLQPSLLDRLTDESPKSAQEGEREKTITDRQLKEVVVRDLESLLNSTRYESHGSLKSYPEVQTSVINYGIPDLSGVAISGLDLATLERDLRNAIIAFEPRINRSTLTISGMVERKVYHQRGVEFEIVAEIWGDPAPMRLMLKTELDLESGLVSIKDFG